MNYIKHQETIADNHKLHCRGNIQLIMHKDRTAAVVGNRDISEYTKQYIKKMPPRLLARDYIICTGLSSGVDYQMATAYLKAGGKVIGVLPTGLNQFKKKNLNKYIESGHLLLVSEYPNNASWTAKQAFERNHVIIDLSSKVFILQSTYSGGTWNDIEICRQKKKTTWFLAPVNEKTPQKGKEIVTQADYLAFGFKELPLL